MVTSLSAEVGQRLLRARIQLALQQPFLASSLMRLPLRECAHISWCSTMATDGYHIFFNPTWTSKLTDGQMRGVLAHEVLHVLFAHGERIQGRDPKRWNIACDFAVNLLLVEQGFSIPEGGVYSRQFAGLTSEDIYAQLPERRPSASRFPKVGVSIDSEQEQSGVLVEVGTDLVRADDPRISPLRSAGTPDREQLDELLASLRSEIATKLHGLSAARFRQECVASDETKIDWRALLRQWLNDRVKSDWSTYPFSKKHIHRGLYMPSMGVESPGEMVFAIDTSGSMSEVVLSEITAELRAFRETFPCRLTVIQADAAIQSVEEYSEFDGTEVPKIMTIAGRGGTNFCPVFEWLANRESRPRTVVIYATDGFGTFPNSAPDSPMIWLMTANGLAKGKIPFGAVARMSGR